MTAYPVFDGHNDLLNCLWADGDREGAGFFAGRAGFADGFFAIWVPGDPALDPPETLRFQRRS